MATAAPRIVKQVFDQFPLKQLPPLYAGPAPSTRPTLFMLKDHAKSCAVVAFIKLLGLDLDVQQTNKHSHTSHPYLLVGNRILAGEPLHERLLQLAEEEPPAPSLKSAGLALFAALEDALVLADYMDQTSPLAWRSKEAGLLQIAASQMQSMSLQLAKEPPAVAAIHKRYISEEDTWTTLLVTCRRNLEALQELAPKTLQDLEDKEMAAMIVGYISTITNYTGNGRARKEVQQTTARYADLVRQSQYYASL
ncbi:hypothetical protein BCR37DRAFT_395281 [Protomyces lactucae-debilis]|uniref:Uncharacterized protein n=1 Tax=Protomyces lactucae-debilis TaxID=2754530 RepID=A0A1Y2EXN9_PROLT|nr:uncharacterized protein BCR37DRAFT_395281 [Protomyces lactucae-debilis]ORY76340.1 hypothetical protein BCR37DRAFT_395281 [Protomyces lactucae-debilis]